MSGCSNTKVKQPRMMASIDALAMAGVDWEEAAIDLDTYDEEVPPYLLAENYEKSTEMMIVNPNVEKKPTEMIIVNPKVESTVNASKFARAEPRRRRNSFSVESVKKETKKSCF